MSTETNTREKYRKLNEKCYENFYNHLHQPGVKYWTIDVLYKGVQELIQTLNPYANSIDYCINSYWSPDTPCLFIYSVETGCLSCMRKPDETVLAEISGESVSCDEEEYTYFIQAMETNALRLKAEADAKKEESPVGHAEDNRDIHVVSKEVADAIAASAAFDGRDPSTIPLHNESVKNDILDGKLPWELLPMATLEPVVEVYGAGAKKYGPNRWQYLENGFERYRAAALRHLNEYMKGNRYDSDTGCQHLAQFVWNGIAMLNYDMRGIGAIPGNAKEGDDMLTADGVQKVHRLPPHEGAFVDINGHLRSAIKSAVDTVNPLQEG